MFKSSIFQNVCPCMGAKLLQSCLTLCDPMDCSLPGSSVHGVLQAGILKWVAMPPPGDLLQPGMEPTSLKSPALASRVFTTSATWEAQLTLLLSWKSSPFYKIWAICKATLQPSCGHDNFSTADPRVHFWSQALFYPRPSDLQLPVYYEESSPVYAED